MLVDNVHVKKKICGFSVLPDIHISQSMGIIVESAVKVSRHRQMLVRRIVILCRCLVLLLMLLLLLLLLLWLGCRGLMGVVCKIHWPLIDRCRGLLMVGIKPLVLSNIWKSALLSLLDWPTKWLIMHLTLAHMVRLVQRLRWWSDEQSVDASYWSVGARPL